MGVLIRNNRLYIDFYCFLPDGSKRRTKECMKMDNTKANLRYCQNLFNNVMTSMNLGTFDYPQTFPHGNLIHYFGNPISDMMFTDLWEAWSGTWEIRPNTERTRWSSYTKHIEPYFRNHMVRAISEDELIAFRKVLSHKLKASSINAKEMKFMSMALRYAMRRGIIEENPCDYIRRLKEDKVDVDPFNEEELDALLDYIGRKKPDMFNMFFIWSRTGLRPGEVCALKWRNVDFRRHIFLIRETRLWNGIEGPPKTDSSNRTIKMIPSVYQAFKAQEAQTRMLDGYVFLNEKQEPYSTENIRSIFDNILRHAGIRFRSPGQLRHTFASLYIQKGANIVWVSKTMGHRSLKLTLDTYTDYLPDVNGEDGMELEQPKAVAVEPTHRLEAVQIG